MDGTLERARVERPARAPSAPPLVELVAGERARVGPEAALVSVERGAVALEIRTPGAPRGVVACIAGRGDVLLPPAPDEALRALGPAAVRVLDGDARRGLLAAPETALALAEALASQLRDREESIAQLAWPLHGERLRAKLVQLARRHGRVTRGGIRIDLPLTHQLLADAIGSARETVTVAIRDLRRDGFLAHEGRSYVLKLGPDELA